MVKKAKSTDRSKDLIRELTDLRGYVDESVEQYLINTKAKIEEMLYTL
jgi:hypothetical protein